MLMKKLLVLLALGVLAPALPTSHAASSKWDVRLRATYLETVDRSDPFTALGINFGANAVRVSDRLIPEIDVAYRFSDVLAAELVLTIPQKHTVSLTGAGPLGSFKHLPPTLLLQYRPRAGEKFHPYAGIGVNYTLIFDDNLAVAGVPLGLESSSVGLAGQLGADWKINDTWSLNLDLKRAVIRSDVSAGAALLTEARLDPWMYSIGLRRSF